MTIDAPRSCHIPALRNLWKHAFGDTDDFLDVFFSLAYSPDRCRCVFMEDRLAAVLYWFNCNWEGKRLAYLYAVATDEAFRGKGLCRALMKNTHAHLQSLGYEGSILVPGSPELFNLYEKMGYKTCSYIREFTCAAGAPISLQRLTAEKYAVLRRQYLPLGGVVQEEEALALLQTQAAFYAGEYCLLVCSTEGEKTAVHELLGDESAAPGIVAALGFREGRFRVPGNEKAFAMYLSLTDDPAAAAYFGLAID